MFKDSDIIVRTRKYDAYSVTNAMTEGQIVFVPKNAKWQDLRDCFEAAYKWGYDWVDKGYCQSFHILQNVGIDFAILGTEESCTGDPAKRAGNEFLFQNGWFKNKRPLNVDTC